METKLDHLIGEVWKDEALPKSRQWRVQTPKGPLHISFRTKRAALAVSLAFAHKVKYPTIESFKEAAEKALGIPLVVREKRASHYCLDVVTSKKLVILSYYVYDSGDGFQYGGTECSFQETTKVLQNLTR
jgi:hypothetical protein